MRFDEISKETPHLINLRPGGERYLIDFDRAEYRPGFEVVHLRPYQEHLATR
jgi:dihydroxyacid dehydratase/phosphogluconate dehydratase